MSKETMYLETSFISYLVSKFSRDQIVLTRQIISREFWETERGKYDLCLSQAVIDEISRGDPEMVYQRQEKVKEVLILDINEEILELAEIYFQHLQIPEKSKADSLHLAVSSYHKVNYVLTWNLTHLANPILIVKLDRLNRELGKFTPMIVAPENLF